MVKNHHHPCPKGTFPTIGASPSKTSPSPTAAFCSTLQPYNLHGNKAYRRQRKRCAFARLSSATTTYLLRLGKNPSPTKLPADRFRSTPQTTAAAIDRTLLEGNVRHDEPTTRPCPNPKLTSFPHRQPPPTTITKISPAARYDTKRFRQMTAC